MKLHRRGMTITFAALGIAGVLAGGAGVAMAATGTSGPSTGTTAATSPAASGICPLGWAGMPGSGFGRSSIMTAAARYLGLSQADLVTRMHAGQSLADVAGAQGKSVSGLEDAITAAIRGDVQANTALSADEKATILAQLRSRIDAMVATTHRPGAGFGTMGRGMMDGPMMGTER